MQKTPPGYIVPREEGGITPLGVLKPGLGDELLDAYSFHVNFFWGGGYVGVCVY
jgi:hypothetical protein